MSKRRYLDNLFNRWKTEVPNSVKFKWDGIIDEGIYEKQNEKYLFICKEPNDPAPSKGGDYRDEWNRGMVDYRFCRVLHFWYQGIIANFPDPDILGVDKRTDPIDIVKTLQSIAFMNLKKEGGAGSSSIKKIRENVESQKHLILEQIKIIDPDIIVGGGLFDDKIWREIFPGITFKKSGYNINIAKWGYYKIVDFYHPSARVPLSMSYSLLENVLKSATFKAL